MNHPLNGLYSEIIKEHSDTPFHFEKIADSAVTLKAYNSICGDKFELYINQRGNKIESIHFHGFGCAISKASTSVLAKSLAGKTIQEALRSCESFLQFVHKDSSDNDLTLPNEFKAFSGVLDFPERIECAALSWTEMIKFLRTQDQ